MTEQARGRSVCSVEQLSLAFFIFCQDVWNGVAGGLASGLVIAIKTQRGVVGAGAGLCYAALSAITEYNDNTLTVRNPRLTSCALMHAA